MAAESAAEIHFNQIHKPSKKRIRYEKVVPGIGPVEASDIVKGYPVDQDTYVVLEPEELEAIRLESKKVIELSQFVDRDEIDPRYFRLTEVDTLLGDASKAQAKLGWRHKTNFDTLVADMVEADMVAVVEERKRRNLYA